MNKEQFEVARAIVELSKAFADQMRKSMVRSGLFEDGYRLTLDIFPTYEVTSNRWLKNTISISDGKVINSFCCYKYRDEGWKTMYVPEKIDTGTADAECKRDPESEEDGAGTETEKPLAPDGLWISSADDTNYVQDWRFDVT